MSSQPQAPQIMLNINAQYVKDISFENPNAPQILVRKEQPKLNLSVDVRASKLGNDAYEVELLCRAEAKIGEDIAFIVELNYAGLFTLKVSDESTLQPLLLIECPRLLFPFARAIVANVTREGGFPPLSINPIDFVDLYRTQLQKAQAAGTPAGATKQG